MVTLAVLPGMLKTSLVVADLANPGNSSKAINLLVSQPGIVGLAGCGSLGTDDRPGPNRTQSLCERATCRAKAGGRDDHEDDPATNPDSGPIVGCREIEWWRPLDSGFMATSERSGDPESMVERITSR